MTYYLVRCAFCLPAETSEASATDHAATSRQAFAAALERTGSNNGLPNDGALTNCA